MASWTALNVAGDDARECAAQERATEEAQDADNAALYGQALRCQQRQQVEEAKQIYLTLLNGDVVVNSRLEYLCNKNLASMEFEDHQFEAALEYFAAALALDATDVVVWYQMATTAVETGKLWLARRTLEEGMKVDSTYWPLVATLAEVLHEIGDLGAYERIAAYIRANDPHCATVKLIDQRNGTVSDLRDSVLARTPTSGKTQRKQQLPSRDRKLLNRAQRRLDHVHEIAENRTNHRRLLQEEMNNTLKASMQARQYQLQQASWTNLGKLLLEAFEDVNRDTSADISRSAVNIQVCYAVSHASSANHEQNSNASVTKLENGGSTTPGDEKAVNEIDLPPAKRQKHQGVVSALTRVDSHGSDNDTQDSGAHASELDEFLPRRRKSRRNEERQREEHAAAVKRAQEKDLAYRLGAFLPKTSGEGNASPKAESLKWLSPLSVKLIDTGFRISNAAKEVVQEAKEFPFPTLSDGSNADSASPTKSTTSQGQALGSLDAVTVTGEQIAGFIVEQDRIEAQQSGILDWVRQYLNQCGQWAHTKLGGDGEDIHQVLTWLEKVLNGDLAATTPGGNRHGSIVSVDEHSLVQGSRFEGHGLTLSAQLFLLELHFDTLLQKPVRGKRRRRLRKRIEDQLGRAHKLLFEFGWLEDSDEIDATCRPSQRDFVRLLWLLARMYEHSGNPQMAQSYYHKSKEKLQEIEDSKSDADGDCCMDKSIRVSLPNQKADSEITLEILGEKISGLRFSDVCSEARRLFTAGNYDQVISILLGHFFPSNQAPRMTDFLSEYETDEDGSQSQSEESKGLFAMVLESIDRSANFSDDDAILLLLTVLHHVLAFLEGLSANSEPSMTQNEEAYPNALEALKFLLTYLSENMGNAVPTSQHRLLISALSVKCLEPSILLRFDCPSTTLAIIRALLEAVTCDSAGVAIAADAIARLFVSIRSLSGDDVRELLLTVQHPAKRKHPRRERVRVVLVDLLQYLNSMCRNHQELGVSLSLPKRNVLMTACCALMKEEEETVTRSDGKTAKQLFGNGAILFIALYESSCRPLTTAVPSQLVELIHLLHERLGQHGICGLTYFGDADSAAHRTQSCFLETCIVLLSKFDKHKNHNFISRDGSKSPTGSASDGTEDSEDEEEAEAEDLFKKELCQCYRCMYDVQILPGCDDHKTGSTFATLQKAEPPSKLADAMRLAHFAVPILLGVKPKNNGQKKERLKLLHAVRDALSSSSYAAVSAQALPISPSLSAYLSPRGLLQHEDDLQVPIDGSSKTEQSDDEACLSHLWYLLGANFILGRVRRRGNLGELTEMEQQVKERVEYLTKDVLCYHPNRVDSWIRLGKTMKELYHAATDAFAAVLGRKLRVQALLRYTSNLSVVNPDQSMQDGDSEQKEYALPFEKVVLTWNLFGKMKEWQTKTTDAHSKSSTNEEAKKEPQEHATNSLPIEEFATAYIAQVIEFSRRCFSVGARLGEVAAKERELKLSLQSKSESNADDDDNFDEELDSLRTTVIECNEECGLLLFNVLQEFSLLKEENPARFPVAAYLQLTEQALAYFRKGMEICATNDDANEVRFRLLYIIGKTLKKKRWCQLRQDEAPDPEALDTATEMAACFSKAEEAREEGDMEHALVHAFYALQGLRAELLTMESPSVSALRLVCDHFYEEEEEEEEDGDDGSQSDASATKNSSQAESKAAKAVQGSTTQDNDKLASASKKDEVMALIADTESDAFTREVKVTVARGWLALNIIDALESIPDEDRYFHPSRYVLARIVYWLSNIYQVLAQCGYNDALIDALLQAIDERRSQLKVEGPSDAAERAIKEMGPLFDKRRPQVVAIWFTEYIPTAKKFEELNQRQMKFDYYRLKYWRFYISMLEENMAYARLKEVGTWVLACKEEHDVISIMLGIVLKARGKVLRARLQRFITTAESATVILPSVVVPQAPEPPSAMLTHLPMHTQLPGNGVGPDAVLKQLAKAYSYYLEVADAQTRLTKVMDDSSLLLEHAELPMVAVFFMGVTAFPSQMPLLHKDVAIVDRDFRSNVTVIKNALRRDELPPRIYDAQGREAWRAYLEAAKAFCEDKWPERTGKGKSTKGRSRNKAQTAASVGGGSDASQSALDSLSQQT